MYRIVYKLSDQKDYAQRLYDYNKDTVRSFLK